MRRTEIFSLEVKLKYDTMCDRTTSLKYECVRILSLGYSMSNQPAVTSSSDSSVPSSKEIELEHYFTTHDNEEKCVFVPIRETDGNLAAQWIVAGQQSYVQLNKMD